MLPALALVGSLAADEASSGDAQLAQEARPFDLPAPPQWKPGEVTRQGDGTVSLAPLDAGEGEVSDQPPTVDPSSLADSGKILLEDEGILSPHCPDDLVI